MNIREIGISELEHLLELYQDLHESDEPLTAEEAADAWDEIMSNPRIKHFGAFVDGHLVSSCHLTVIPNLTWSSRPYSLIENVVTKKGWRRRGYGKAVLLHALDYAWQCNCYKVMLMTGRLNEGVFAFYESLGFRRNEKEAFIIKKGY